MNINYVLISVMVIAVGIHLTHAYFSLDKPPPSQLPWVPISVGKQRSFHSQTRDAGLYTQTARRLAVINGSCGRSGGMKDKSSTNGSLEYYFLSALCPARPNVVCPPYIPEVEDGGNANTESCVVFDENSGDLVDFGNADTNICPV
jgi:hypothetical protein